MRWNDMKKAYEEPEFNLVTFSFEDILEDRMNGSQPEGQGAGEGWD